MEPGPSPAPRCRRVPPKKTQRAGRTRATDPRYPAWRALLRLRARPAAAGHPPHPRGHSRRQPSCFDEFTKKTNRSPPAPEKEKDVAWQHLLLAFDKHAKNALNP